MKRLTAAIAVLFALSLTACDRGGAVGVGTPPPSTSSPAPSPTASHTPKPTSSPPATGKTSVEVWLSAGERLHRAQRIVPEIPAIGTVTLKMLIAGPTDKETVNGVGTQIPTGTRLLGLSIANSVATVNLSSSFGGGGGVPSETMRLAQVVYTLTQFPTVQAVRFQLDGRPVTVFGDDGIVLNHDVTRKDYEALLPAITVSTPKSGATVHSPISVSGSANVFEATVSIRILDGAGHVVGKTFTTATCGTGCRGTYSTTVRYRVGSSQWGTVMVYEASAKDGQPVNVVRVPVYLTA